MSKSVQILFILLSFIFFSCTDGQKVTRSIKQWELAKNNYKVNHIELSGESISYYYLDSSKVLEKELNIFMENKTIQLQSELTKINLRIESTKKKIEETQNALMKRAIHNKLYELEKEKQNHIKIISIYNTNPELTQIGVIREQVLKYQSSPEKLIGYVYQAKSKGFEGNFSTISKNKQYLLAPNLKKVWSEFED